MLSMLPSSRNSVQANDPIVASLKQSLGFLDRLIADRAQFRKELSNIAQTVSHVIHQSQSWIIFLFLFY